MAKAEYQVNWGYQRQYLPELYDKPLWQLRAEVERLKREADNGNKYSKSRLDAVQQVLDERSTEEEAVWKQDFRHGNTHVHIHNNVTAQAPTHIAQAPTHLAQQQPPQPPATQMSTAAALGLGAGIAALMFMAFSGVAVLAIFGLFAALLILAILGVAYLLHRRDSRDLPKPKAPRFDTAQSLAVAPEPQAIEAETQDIRRLEHKPARAITAQSPAEATPLVRKSSEVSTVRHTSKAVKVRR